MTDFTSWAAMIGAGVALLLLLGKGGTFLSNAPADLLTPFAVAAPPPLVACPGGAARGDPPARHAFAGGVPASADTGFLEIPSPTRPDRVYRIPRGPGQVLVEERGRVMERLCLQPEVAGLPEADVVLMHKLLIEADEDRYLATANHFPRSLWRY